MLLTALTALLAACEPDSQAAAPQPRPVRTVTVTKSEAGQPVTLTGRIEAEDEVTLGFRVPGRVLENTVRVGDRLTAGQRIARLEPQNETNALRTAQANLVAAQAQLTQAQNHFDRQDTLLQQGWTTRAIHDQADKQLQTARAQVDAAQAQTKAAHDQVSFTELVADAPGVITDGRAARRRGRAGRPDDRQACAQGRARCGVRCARAIAQVGAARSGNYRKPHR